MAASAAAMAAGPFSNSLGWAAERQPGSKIKLGLVTYMWGAEWDLSTIIKNLEASGVLGVELRTTHAHGVEPDLTAKQRAEVKRRFDDSPAELVGLGSNENFDNPDPAVLKKSIEATKDFVRLSRDVGSSGVKVKPNSFHKGVDHKKTIEQIGRSLNEVGRFAGDLGQQIRLEVHGQCSPPPIMKQIMDVADNPNVVICWNSNKPDLEGKGLRYNFNLLKDRMGPTCHIRTLDYKNYPFQELVDLFVAMDYDGWLLMECTDHPKDVVAEMARQKKLLAEMIVTARKA
ncbi:MAG: sugar phosphate isomerase/epimerase [Pirellulales bacterium]|nr:sugar phosphate isomerase/epimerase [Pirellulales bacterium]